MGTVPTAITFHAERLEDDDVWRRVRWFLGQLSHFYDAAWGSPGGGPKRNDLTPSNVRRCLERDRDYLQACGTDPRGFVAGGWAFLDVVRAWLAEQAVAYDCTPRSFSLGYDAPDSTGGDGWKGPALADGVVELPTTGPITAIAAP